MSRIVDPVKRFWDRVTFEPNSGCWLWTGNCKPTGYGELGVTDYPGAKSKKVSSHRYSYELHNGSIDDGLCVLHRCDVRCCVNPDHLFLGTKKDNYDDAVSKGRNHTNSKRSRCKRGHRLSGDNVYVAPNGNRACRECNRAAWRAYRLRKIAKERAV